VKERPFTSVVMNSTAVARLPKAFREVVEHDRKIENEASQPIVDFETMVRYFKRRSVLTGFCDRLCWKANDDK